MRRSKFNTAKSRLKDKAFAEFKKGKLTQRDIAKKYKICETELSRYFSKKYKSAGYPQTTSK